MKVCLNYHNLGCTPQFGINKVHPIIFKNHIEICNDFDDDCDGKRNDLDDDWDQSTGFVAYVDNDGDGSGA